MPNSKIPFWMVMECRDEGFPANAVTPNGLNRLSLQRRC